MDLNKIYLGNAYELIKQLPDKSIDVIYTDIPYLIKFGGGSDSDLSRRMQKTAYELGDGRTTKNYEQKLAEYKEKMDNAESKEEYNKWHCFYSNLLRNMNIIQADIVNGIDYKILDEFVRVCKSIYVYIWCSREQILDLMNYFVGQHNCRFNLLVWCKTNCVPATNNTWLPNLEYCLVFKSPDAPRYNDGYDLKSKWYMSAVNKFDKDQYNHPTIKPLELVERHLKHSCKSGDVVLDPFIGSGTTALAAKHLGLNYIGFEINEAYHKIAVDRLSGINQKGELNLFDMDNEEE